LADPLRRVLFRLIAPMMGKFLVAHDEFCAANDELNRRLDEAHQRIDWLTDEIAAANALVWDQVALSRRLADLEDRLSSSEPELIGGGENLDIGNAS
jgi:predicted alpha-1,6-mannanase (GH76 family)